MLTREQLRTIRRIQIRTSHLVNDLFAGAYTSAFKGRGMEFDEVRPYIPGDEVRTIDWNVTARTGAPHVKSFVEERELTVMLLVDASRSTHFGSRVQLKRKLAAEIAAVLAFAAITNDDKVGLVVFTDRIELSLPPRKGTRHVLRVVREILGHESEGRGTDVGLAIDHLNRVTLRRTITFLISDLLAPELRRPLGLARHRHDLVAVVLEDPRDHEIPPVGLLALEDPESGDSLVVDTSDPKLRRAFADARRQAIEERDHLLRSLRVDSIGVRTDEPYADALIRFFRRRERRG